jgi:hypothetical protein
VTATTLEGFELSTQQRRLWHLPGGPEAYVTRGWVELEGDLDAARLRAALLQVVERHEILRTGYDRLPGMELPVQVIGRRAAVDFREVDLSAVPAAKRPELHAWRWAERSGHPGAVGSGPLVRGWCGSVPAAPPAP